MPGRRNQTTTTSPTDETNPNDNWFQQHCPSNQHQLIFTNDTTQYPFHTLLSEWLDIPSSVTNLEQVRTHFESLLTSYFLNSEKKKEPIVLHPAIKHAYISSKMTPPLSSTMSHTRKNGLYTSVEFIKFMNISFVCTKCHSSHNLSSP
mmetsp:Transcript_1484/g.1982  ORF Transcript_1484/g.1982 Transcript_1484/m.1982 type:complete len:148 (+) Transcript_1484:137-580(+)